MSKGNKLKYIIMIISIVLALTGVVIWGVLRNDNNLKENTVIEIDGETSETFRSEIKGIYPGKTVNYNISLTGDMAKEHFITLDFFEDNGGELKKYIIVGIVTENGSIDKSLQELLDGESISLGQGIDKITISYTMPVDTGDEAQEASVVFKIKLNAENVEE